MNKQTTILQNILHLQLLERREKKKKKKRRVLDCFLPGGDVSFKSLLKN